MRSPDASHWTQEGTFADVDGERVRCYDDVALIRDANSEPDGNGNIVLLSAGTCGTVLFYSTTEPCLLELEYDVRGVIFGFVPASCTRLAVRNEEKYPR